MDKNEPVVKEKISEYTQWLYFVKKQNKKKTKKKRKAA